MRIGSRIVSLAVAAVLVAAPAGAFTLLESNQKVPVVRGDTFRAHVQLRQAALCDGSVKLAPGEYDVQILSMGDGSVRASFFLGGVKKGEANGVIAIIKSAAAAAPPAGTNLPAVQQSQGAVAHKVAPAAPSEQLSLNFTKLGFGVNSRSSVSQQGQKLNLEFVSSDGSHGILIGLLVPAVQKVREAAAQPH